MISLRDRAKRALARRNLAISIMSHQHSLEIERERRSAIADRNPSGGDVQQAPSRSDESGGAGTAIAQPQTPIARGG